MGFYDNLTGNGVFFFWIAIILACFLVGLAIFLLLKNKKLSNLLKEEQRVVAFPIEEAKKEVVDNKDDSIIKETKDETVVEPEILMIENKKESNPEEVREVVTVENREAENKFKDFDEEEIPKLFDSKEDVKKSDAYVNSGESKAYRKNVLREMSKKMPISPIHIERYEEEKNYDDTDDFYDLEQINLKEESYSPLEEMEDSYEVNDNMRYANDIVSRMEEELKPSNIELTDYEKKQEEEAIISYDELQKVKDKIYNLTEEEEDGEFIDELKSFRSDL